MIINGTSGNDTLNGGPDNDVLYGLDGLDHLYGNEGNDTLSGDAHGDHLFGGLGNDSMDGGAGYDTLTGGAGDDTLTGGEGSDIFYIWNGSDDTTVDTITDFTAGPGGDQLSIPDYLDNPLVSGHVRLTQSGANILFEVDPDGSEGAAVFRTVAILNNVTRSHLVAANVGGFDPNPIMGTAAADSLSGGAGNDDIYGLAGKDSVAGGGGSDTLTGGAGDDTLTGGAGSDYFRVWNGSADTSVDTITDFTAGLGGDRLSMPTWGWGLNYYPYGDNPFASGHVRLTQSGANTLFEVDPDGTIGAAVFHTVAILNNVTRSLLVADNLDGFDPNAMGGTAAADSLSGGAGNDEIYGFAGNDTLSGLAGNDRLYGGSNNDVLNGGNGNDRLYGNEGNDGMTGGAGYDSLTGGAGDDTLEGGDGVDQLYADEGNDSLSGGTGNDSLTGGTGDDTLEGGDGHDELYGNEGNDSMAGGAGFDYLYGGAGDDTLDGGADNDSVYYSDATGPVTVNLALGTATGAGIGSDTLISVERVYGSQYADILTGDWGNNSLRGDGGNDTLTGGAGSDDFEVSYGTSDTSVDTITDFIAGPSGDRLSMGTTGSSNPFLSGHARLTQSGANTLFEMDPDGAVGADTFRTVAILINVTRSHLVAYNVINALASVFDPNTINGTAEDNSLSGGMGNEEIYGLAGNDTLSGLAGDDRLYGGAGNDVLDGGVGSDWLTGDEGNDSMAGGAGSDTLTGDAGNDTLTGGVGTDYFSVWNGAADTSVDTITDFLAGPGGDRLSTPTWGLTYYTSGDNPFASGHVRLTQSGANTLFEVDPDGSVGAGVFRAVAILNNVITSNLVADNLNGFDPNPILGTAAADSLSGGAGNDEINGFAGDDTLNGLAGDDRLYGGADNDMLNGLAGDDRLYGGSGNDRLNGGAGFDTLIGGAGNDTLDGGAITDWIGGNDYNRASYDASTAGVTVNLGAGAGIGNGTANDGLGGTDTLININQITGSRYADSITGSSSASVFEQFEGGAGDDTIDGGQGYDLVDYTTSPSRHGVYVTLNDTLDGSASDDGFGYDDTLCHIEGVRGSAHNDTLTGSDSAPFESFEGGAGNDQINGKGGIDRVDYTSSPAGVIVNLATGTASDGYGRTDTMANIENVRGARDFNDSLTGSTANNKLEGLGGNDTLDGGAGSDTLAGGDGSDTYVVRDSGDVVSETNAVLATGGSDTVYSTLAAYTLTNNVENGRILSTTAANLTGNTLNNILYAGAGNNVLNGSTGIDTVSYAFGLAGTTGVTVSLAVGTAQATGGSGSDTLTSIENLIGSAYADKLTGNTGANSLGGGAGNDTLDGGAGNDTLAGGDGSDTYVVRDGGDVVSETNAVLASGGSDTVYSYLSTYTLTANVENGRILATGAANLTGNTLNNVLYAGAGSNVLNGGTGIDTVSYAYGLAGTSGVTVSLAVSTAQATGGSGSDTLTSIENLIGSAYADRLTGNTGANSLGGGAGNDTLDGGAGSDTLGGGDGSDTYVVRDGGDVVSETNAVLATGGTDTVYSTLAAYTLTNNVENGRILSTTAANLTGNTLNNILYAGAGNNVLDGGTGIDTVSYAYGLAGTSGVTVSLAVGTAQATGGSGSDTLTSIENLIGSAYADRLTGNTGANSLAGGAGSDTLDGGAGNDTLAGGDGSDTYVVRDGGDVVSETNAVLATGGSDTVYSTLAAYTLTANVENGRILATVAANLTGNTLNNVLYAGAGSNVLDGGTGIDTVSYAYGLAGTSGVTVSLAVGTAQATGGSGSDTLISIENLIGSGLNDNLTGNAGNNTLDGGAGNDLLSGGVGRDLLTGGAGSDSFDFNALSEMGLTSATWDVINDFVHSLDRIDLSTLDANAALAGNQAFSAPVVGGTFSGAFATAGDLYFDNVAHVLYGNTDADAAAEFAIQLVGVTTLTAADLFL